MTIRLPASSGPAMADCFFRSAAKKMHRSFASLRMTGLTYFRNLWDTTLGDDDPAACLFRPGYGRLLFRELDKEEIDESPRPRPARGACQAHAQEEYHRLQHVGVPQPGVARYFVDVLLLGLAEFLDHGLDFASDALVRQVRGGRFVNKTGVHQRLIGLDERTDRGDQVAVQERPISAGAFTQSEAESHDEVLAFEQKLLRDLNLGKQVLRIFFGRRQVVGVRVLPRLLQIRTVAGAVERDLALLTTALRADFSVHRRAKPLLSTLVTDRTGQRCFLRIRLFHGKSEVLPPRRRGRREGLLLMQEQRGIETAALRSLVAKCSQPVFAPFLMQIGKANGCHKRFLFVCL